MFSSRIIISSPWYYFLLSFLIGSGVSLWLYYRNKKNKEVPGNVLLLMSTLRFLSTSLIVLFLLAIFLKHLQNETQNPVILVAIDNSSSMVATADSTYIKSGFIKELESFRETLAGKFTVKTLFFGDKVISASLPPAFSEKETDLENLINEVDNNYSNQNVGALVLVSDGIYNKGSNPLYASEKLNYPIYTLAVGDTSEPRDLLIQKVEHNQVAYLGNSFPVEVVVRAKKYKGKEVSLTLLRDGVEKAKQMITLGSGDLLSSFNFTLNAEQSGLAKYTARLSVIPGEKNSSNNSQSFVIEVIDNREKILLLASSPHPDIAALKDAITNSTAYDLEYALTGEFKKPLKPYSLVIIHGFNSSQQALLNECKDNGVPCWIINPATLENLPGIRITGSLSRSNDAEPFSDPSFGLFALSDGLKKFINDLPAVKTPFGNYDLKNGSVSLLKQRIGTIETDNPILLFNESSGLKSAIFIGDGLWKWKMRDFEAHDSHQLFQELIGKSIQYLSVKSDKSFFRITAPKIINENENVTFAAEVYNKSYELITDPEVSFELTNAEHKKFNYTFSKTDKAYKLNIGLLSPGEYHYAARVKSGSELFIKQGILIVREVVAERINTVADHGLLYQLSRRSNGKMYYPRQLADLQKTILQNDLIKPITYSQTSSSLLIDLKWLFWLVLLLLSSEWFFRKRFLSI